MGDICSASATEQCLISELATIVSADATRSRLESIRRDATEVKERPRLRSDKQSLPCIIRLVLPSRPADVALMAGLESVTIHSQTIL